MSAHVIAPKGRGDEEWLSIEIRPGLPIQFRLPSTGYVELQLIIFAGSLFAVIEHLFGSILPELFEIALIAFAGSAVFLLADLDGIRTVVALLRGDRRVALIHAGFGLSGPAAALVGFTSGSALALAVIEPQIDAAFAQQRAGLVQRDADVVVVSINPELVYHRTGYRPGFAAPGSSTFVILDRSTGVGSRRSIAMDPPQPSDCTPTGRACIPCHVSRFYCVGPYSIALASDIDDLCTASAAVYRART